MTSRTTAFNFDADSNADIARNALQIAAARHENARRAAAEAARALADDHRPEVEIAIRLGVTRTTVRRWIGRDGPRSTGRTDAAPGYPRTHA